MIAMKREVAAESKNISIRQVFRGANVKLGNWRQVTVRITTVSRFVKGRKVRTRGCKKRERRVCFSRHTRESVQSPLVVLKLKVRKGGDFFYGKSSNENHTEGV